MYTALFLLIEVETDQIAFLGMIIVQIADKLFFTTGMILIPSPYLHFNHMLLSIIIDYYICTS